MDIASELVDLTWEWVWSRPNIRNCPNRSYLINKIHFFLKNDNYELIEQLLDFELVPPTIQENVWIEISKEWQILFDQHKKNQIIKFKKFDECF